MKNKRAAYLVMDDMGDYVTDFHLSIEPMADLGWEVIAVPWRSTPDWNDFDAVYICTPWDYPQHAEEFLRVLAAIEASDAMLLNDLTTVKWNLDKSYMKAIAARGEDIVPSAWFDEFDIADVPSFFTAHAVNKVVIKPTVGANAMDTYVLTDPVSQKTCDELAEIFKDRAFFVQPFIDNIREEGEYSLFFFNGDYSHAIVKVPKAGDFRVQEEHGAAITPTKPPIELRAVAERVFSHLEPMPTYGRGDWVRGSDGRFLLMELELIEPSLYLRTDSGAALRFAHAFERRFKQLTGL